MSGKPDNLLLRYERPIAIGFWVLYLGIGAIVESLSVLTEYGRIGRPLAPWEPFVWEFSSAVMTGLLILGVVRVANYFPLRRDRWRRPLVVHLLATIPYTLIHVGGMVLIRKLAYQLAGRFYDFGNLAVELPYEYRKDFVTYWFILGLVYLWRYLRQLSTARIDSDDDASEPLRRVIAKKRGREFVVNVADVDWIEAAGNYANLHRAEAVYPLRVSMAELEERLDGNRFARVHRSAIVNLDCIAEIQPTDTGDYRIRLRDGTEVRMSRRYRAALKGRLE